MPLCCPFALINHVFSKSEIIHTTFYHIRLKNELLLDDFLNSVVRVHILYFFNLVIRLIRKYKDGVQNGCQNCSRSGYFSASLNNIRNMSAIIVLREKVY